MSSSSSSSSTASATSTAVAGLQASPQFKVVGIVLAIVSGLLIGSSFVFKKKGLLSSQGTAGEGVAYLKSWLWWTGMSMMILGELCNFAAYAFVAAIVVTPMGALSVVICAILSSIFLKEALTFFGWVGCFLCIVGSVIIALNGPQEASANTIVEFQHLFLSLGFIIYGSIIILSALAIIFFVAPRWGKQTMMWYILVCSLFGGLSVSCTQGLGSAIVTTVRGDNQFKHWFIYFLLVFVVITLLTEIYFLNVALALFNTAMVTPTYYVIFTFFTLVTSIVLYQGVKASIIQLITIVMGFLVICAGITILQMSKVDPSSLKKLDRRSTILLEASRHNTELAEKSVSGAEDPGIDALRGGFGGTVGSIIRARSARRMSMSSNGTMRSRGVPSSTGDLESGRPPNRFSTNSSLFPGLQRHQLYDAPVPSIREDGGERISMGSQLSTQRPNIGPHKPTIKFGNEDVAHFYPGPGDRGTTARHEHRPLQQSPAPSNSGLPPPIGESVEDLSDPAAASEARSSYYTAPTAIDPFRDSPPMQYNMQSPDDDESPSAPPPPPPQRGGFLRHGSNYAEGDDAEESVSLVHPEQSNPGGRRSGGVRLLPSAPR